MDPEAVTVEKLYKPLWCYRTLRRVCANHSHAIIHQHTVPIHSALWPVCAAAGRKVKTVFSDYDPPTSLSGKFRGSKKWLKRSMRSMRIYPDWIAPVSEFNARVWETHFGHERIRPIRHGVIAPDHVPVRSTPRGRCWRVAFIGRMMWNKGVREVIQAAELARQSHLPVHFDIYGDGPQASYIRESIANQNLIDICTYHGSSRGMDRVYAAADIVLVPSQFNDPCPMVSLEAMSFGVPAIYSNRGGIPECQVDGETGIMMECGTALEINNALKEMIGNPDRYKLMSLSARRRYEESFTMDRMVDDYMRLYLELLQ